MKEILKKIWKFLIEPHYSLLHLALLTIIFAAYAAMMFCIGRWTPPEDLTDARFVEYNGRRYIEILYDENID